MNIEHARFEFEVRAGDDPEYAKVWYQCLINNLKNLAQWDDDHISVFLNMVNIDAEEEYDGEYQFEDEDAE